MHRRAVLVAVFLGVPSLSLPGVARAQSNQLADDPAIQQTIQDQLNAFASQDLAKAFSFASPSIQGLFQTPESFGLMVRRGYPMVWSPGEIRFGPLRQEAGALWQRLYLLDPDGTRHVLDYRMMKLGRNWRISAVVLLESPALGV